MKSLILKGSLLLLLLTTCLSCQKSWILDGTWVRVCEASYEMKIGAKYEFVVFHQNGTASLWYETAEGIKLNQFTETYRLNDNIVSFAGYELTIRETSLVGSSVIFFRQ